MGLQQPNAASTHGWLCWTGTQRIWTWHTKTKTLLPIKDGPTQLWPNHPIRQSRPQRCPHPWRNQISAEGDRKIPFFSQSLYNTMMHPLNDITSSADVEFTYNATVYFLNYAACQCQNHLLCQWYDPPSWQQYSISSQTKGLKLHRGLPFLWKCSLHQFNDPVLFMPKSLKIWWHQQ